MSSFYAVLVWTENRKGVSRRCRVPPSPGGSRRDPPIEITKWRCINRFADGSSRRVGDSFYSRL